mgnify:CR=1 FL=1
MEAGHREARSHQEALPWVVAHAYRLKIEGLPGDVTAVARGTKWQRPAAQSLSTVQGVEREHPVKTLVAWRQCARMPPAA